MKIFINHIFVFRNHDGFQFTDDFVCQTELTFDRSNEYTYYDDYLFYRKKFEFLNNSFVLRK